MEVGRTVLAIVIMGLGILGALFPHVPWHAEEGWRSHRPPSHTTLLLNRVGGTLVFLIGLWTLLVK